MHALRLTLRQMQIFIAVAQHGSTASASDQIALSQSATSAAINELERLLSLQLFDRVGRRLQLNHNGRALLPRALALLGQASEIEHLGRSLPDQIQTLRIGASTTVGNYVLPKHLNKLLSKVNLHKMDQWQSTIKIANTEAIGNAIANYELDLGFVEGAVRSSDVKSLPWIRDEMVIVGSTPQSPQTIQRLQKCVWLLRENGSGTREAADQALLPHINAYHRTIEFDSSEAIKNAAILGMGLAYLSRWVVDDAIKSGTLQPVQTKIPKAYRPCYAVMHASKAPTEAMVHVLSAFGVKINKPFC